MSEMVSLQNISVNFCNITDYYVWFFSTWNVQQWYTAKQDGLSNSGIWHVI